MKRLLIAALGAVTLLLVASAALAFNKFPPGPGGSCPDTMSINTLRTQLNTLGPCGAVTPNTTGTAGDTVLGVGGIIIGFDEIPTGFDIYIETSGGGQNVGLDVFTSGTNMRPVYGFNYGDSIIVEYARVANYYGDIELLSPNGVFSSPDIVLRKVSSGNPLPPFFLGTTTDFKETPTNTVIAPYMTELVTLTGPIRVARTVGLSTRGMLVVSDAAPSDSVFIDYAKLTSIVPPAVGTVLTSISGIVNSASRGWRIMPRGAFDVIDVVPPGVTDAYAVADDQYRVVFDRDVTAATATNVANYSLASFGTVNTATMDGTNAVILGISGTGLSHGQLETVSVNGITGVANGVTMTSPANAGFLAGVMSPCEFGAPDPDSLAAAYCLDRSRFAGGTGEFINGLFGPRSTLVGTVIAQYGNLYYVEEAASPCGNNFIPPAGFIGPWGPHRGITVFAPPVALTLGHRYVLAGAAEVYYAENEFAAITYVKDVGTPGVPDPIPATVPVLANDVCDVNQTIADGHDYMSALVKLSNVTVVTPRFGTDATRGFDVVAPSSPDTIMIENQNTVLGANSLTNPNYPAVGSVLDVLGCVHYTTSGIGRSVRCFRVCPRSAADITIKDPTAVGGNVPAELAFAVYPNPARTVNVSFALPKSASVDIAVFDLLGRRVAQLASGVLPPGTYRRAWDGTDASGQRVRSGMYFYRMNAGGEIRTARTILIGN